MATHSTVMDVMLDMETGDPDDYFALLLLATHPLTRLRCVTITPGTLKQVGYMKNVLKKLNLDIPVGACRPNHNKECLSKFFQDLNPSFVRESEPDGLGCDIIFRTLQKYPDAVLITGAPLCNVGALLQKYETELKPGTIKRWVGQGGFAGVGVVDEDKILKKFAGKRTCATYNFGGDSKSALLVLESNVIAEKYMVSKNVCHGVTYDKKMHAKVNEAIIRANEHLSDLNKDQREVCERALLGLQAMYDGMDKYLQKRQEGKMFHDPLAVCAAIDRSVCEFRRVTMIRDKGEWGSVLSNDEENHTFISVDINRDLFLGVLTQTLQ
jgi:pyrimidine-specific ribonucleoside hydrolase